jgi:4-amino-4-deoxy-L-arabinose transferase-like glycosyltransferase
VAVSEENVLHVPHAATGSLTRRDTRWLALALAVTASALLAIRLDLPAFFDNEGRYAEVAREMMLRHDWISPHLDFTLFLNKPPLTFWLTAAVFSFAGPTEWARVVSLAAAAVALFATCRLGALLYAETTGLVAGVALATMLGFALESRTLRPDMLLSAAVVVAIACWQHAERSRARRTPWLVGLYVALGVGVLAKGLVPVVLAGVPIGVVTLRAHGWRGLARLRPGLGLAVIAAIVLPWHVAVAFRHPGFAWDYVVNQHLLFFFDKKLPRDSEGDTLAFFWAAFVARALPWVILLPLTLREAVRGAGGRATSVERSTFVLWTWTVGILLFFSAAPSRLEHYSLPALPAVALLAARVWERARAGELSAPTWGWLAVVAACVVLVGAGGVGWGRALLERTYWIAETPAFLALVTPAAATLCVAGGLLLFATIRRRADWLVTALAVGIVPIVVIVLRAEVEAEPLFSWRPLAQTLVASVPADATVVFEAPEEYQLVGGLAYYSGRPIALLRPPGFVPPTYLAGNVDEMFVSRADFERRWAGGERLAFVSDPQRRRDDPTSLVPPPFHVLGRFGDRWLLASFARDAGG